MTREHLTRKLPLVTVAVMLVIISIVLAVQFKTKTDEVKIVAEVNNLPLESQIADQGVEGIPANAHEEAPREKEESTVSVAIPSSGNEDKDVRVADNVSRGTRTTSTYSNSESNESADFWQKRQTWLQPVKGKQTLDPSGGARYFGAPRENGRAHAAIDFIAPNGTLVYAMTDGKITRTSIFFENTSAVEVKNTDGTVTRYCEIEPAVSVGEIVHRGDIIGKIITNYGGTSMLHLEMYVGTVVGSLSQNNSGNYRYVIAKDYERRSDLLDPTRAKDLPIK